MKASTCTPDIMLLSIGPRPYYLPWEFLCAIVVIYIPLSGRAVAASDVIHSTIAGLHTQHPCPFMASLKEAYSSAYSPTPSLTPPCYSLTPTPQVAFWNVPTTLQPLSEVEEGAPALKDLLHCPHAQERTTQYSK